MRTTYASDKILNLYRATTFTAPATVYAGLLTAVTDAEAGTVTETSYGGYARQAITFGVPAANLGGRQTLASAITFPAKSDAGSATIIAVGIFDALTGGNLSDVIMLFDGSPLAAMVNGSDVAGNTIQSPAHGLTTNDTVRVEQFPGDTPIPAGLSENTTYFVIATGLTADVFELSATQGGAAIDITAAGRMLVMKVVSVTVNQNDAPTFAANKLALTDD
jgi:hypothetical protein